MRIVDDAFTQKVEPELLMQALRAIAELPEGDRGFEASTITIVQLMHELNVPQEERAITATAISFRLQALATLTSDGGGRGWIRHGEPGCDFVHEELVRSAAQEPLIQVDGQPAFDPDSFHRHLLQTAEMRGEA